MVLRVVTRESRERGHADSLVTRGVLACLRCGQPTRTGEGGAGGEQTVEVRCRVGAGARDAALDVTNPAGRFAARATVEDGNAYQALAVTLIPEQDSIAELMGGDSAYLAGEVEFRVKVVSQVATGGEGVLALGGASAFQADQSGAQRKTRLGGLSAANPAGLMKGAVPRS